jgi:CarD family transcriptional regulator
VYRIGDKVVYPMHGAGVIEAVEEREILGEHHTYYILRLPIGDLSVMIPVASALEVGLRPVIGEGDVGQVIRLMAETSPDDHLSWNHRYRRNLEKMKTGDIFSVAEVVAVLARRERQKGLSTGERKMLDNARRILLSEICLSRGIDKEEAEALLARALA